MEATLLKMIQEQGDKILDLVRIMERAADTQGNVLTALQLITNRLSLLEARISACEEAIIIDRKERSLPTIN